MKLRDTAKIALSAVFFSVATGALGVGNAVADEADWRPLFDPGLSNAVFDPSVWRRDADGCLTAEKDVAIWTRDEYARFELSCEYCLEPAANSGILLYCSDTENWVPNAIEIQLIDNDAPKWKGLDPRQANLSFFGHQAPKSNPAKPAGEWNSIVVRADGQRLSVSLNGEVVNECDLSAWTDAAKLPDGSAIPPWLSRPWAELATKGKIGLQGRHAGAGVRFRNIRIRSLSAASETAIIDFTAPAGPVKDVNGMCNSRIPFRQGDGDPVVPLWEIEDLGAPYVRLHDTGGPFGGSRFVDIPNVFPDFDADEDDPASYDFAFTDAYLGAIVKAGAKPYYRLGVTIENFYRIKAYHIHPPKDLAKWARICEHVVRHYTKGWANGFKWDMPYWEIWCEPENRMLWLGTRQQFFELYALTAREIKRHHPDIKIGGYGACRFESFENLDVNSDDCRQNWLGWFEEFCTYINDEKTRAPMDFFSWHLYHVDPARYVWHAEDVRRRLDGFGMKDCEAHLTEWSFSGRWGVEAKLNETGAVFAAACLSAFQTAPIEVATYYEATPTSEWCGLFRKWMVKTPMYFVFKRFNDIKKLGTSYRTSVDAGKHLYALAASDGKTKAFWVVNDSYDTPQRIMLDMRGASPQDFDMYRLDIENSGNFRRIGRLPPDGEFDLPWKGVVFCTTNVK